MGGILGKLFHEFATVLTVAIAISAAVSLTLTPMICGRIGQGHISTPKGLVGPHRPRPSNAPSTAHVQSRYLSHPERHCRASAGASSCSSSRLALVVGTVEL